MDAYDSTWQNTILPLLRDSNCTNLNQEYSRLVNEWNRSKEERATFWRNLQNNEIKEDRILLNKKRMQVLRHNVVKQINMTVEDYTLQTEEDIASDRLQDNVECLTPAKASGSRSSLSSHPVSLPNMTETSPPLFNPSTIGVGVKVISQNCNINEPHNEKTSAVPQSLPTSPRAETNEKAKRRSDFMQTSKAPKQRKYDSQSEDKNGNEQGEDICKDGASLSLNELDGPKNASCQKEMQHLAEDYDADDTGYSSSDLYEADDLLHLTLLEVQEEEVQAESQESNYEADNTTMSGNFSVKKFRNKKRQQSFNACSKKSFQKRFESLGSKWELSTGTVVEDKLYEIGQEYKFYSPIHSFMVDCNDTEVARHFTELEWNEICGEWPMTQLEGNTIDYIESFSDVESVESLKELLKERPKETEEQLVFRCLED
ncbi:hypothetical protein BGZ46_004775, partial [Entomortierella lignicola]